MNPEVIVCGLVPDPKRHWLRLLWEHKRHWQDVDAFARYIQDNHPHMLPKDRAERRGILALHAARATASRLLRAGPLAGFSSAFMRWISALGTDRTRPTNASNLANSGDGRGSDFMRLGYSSQRRW